MDLQSKLKTSVPHTIPELYTELAKFVAKEIKESEERMKSWITKEIGKLGKENKDGDSSMPKKSTTESKEFDFDLVSLN